jgi:hypothetical protein
MTRKLKLQRKETRYLSTLVVYVPDVAALIDMLRYDRCCQATEDESRKLWRLLGERCGGCEATLDDHVIRLSRFAAVDKPATEGRWHSYGCRVLDERSPDAEQLDDEAIKNLMKNNADDEAIENVMKGNP